MSEKSNSESNYENSNPNSNDPEEPLYVMTLELEKGRAEQIKIYADSDANELAYAFCKDHDLDFSALEYLKERIESLLTQMRERTESQESQIEEVDDEHTITEDNKILEQELKNTTDAITHDHNKEVIESVNSNDNEKEARLKLTQHNIEHACLDKTKNNTKKEDLNSEILFHENSMKGDSIQDNSNEDKNLNNENEEFEEHQEYSDENDHEQNVFDNDNEDNQENEQEEIEENGDNYEEQREMVQSDENEQQEIEDNDINEYSAQSIENNKEENVLIGNEMQLSIQNKTKEATHEIKQTIYDSIVDKNSNSKAQTKDPFTDKMNQEQMELEEDKEPMEIKIDDNEEKICIEENKINLLEINKKDMKHNKISALHSLSSVTDEHGQLLFGRNEKPQTLPLTSKLSSSNKKEETQQTNYFRSTKPHFAQHIQSTTNTKPYTQTEQKSTSHSPPQSNTTNPTLQNYHSIKSSIKSPAYDQNQHQSPLTNSPSDKDEVEIISTHDNHINLNRYYSYWTKKASQNTNIFDRLFQDAELKRIIPTHHHEGSIQRQNSNSSKKAIQNLIKNQYEATDKPNNMNYGEYLYTKDRIVKEEKEKQISQIKQYQEQQEIYSFKPIISEYKMNSIISSKRIDRIERIKKELNEVYTFKPKINKNYNTELSFNERQDFFTNLYKQRNQELNKYINSNQDENGNLLFHPQLVSKQNEEQIEANIFDKNYNYAYKYKKNKQELSGKIYNEKHIKLSNIQTDKIITNLHNEAFGKLFRELNNDQDSQITPLNLNTKKTSKEILKIINPLLIELKEDNQTLDEAEFISAMEQLYKEISVIEQRVLINQYRNGYKQSKNKEKGMINNNNLNSYKPIINSNTTKLATRHDNKLTQKYPGLIGKKKENVTRENYFKLESKKTLETLQNFSNIHNYTFDNYVKNLN